MAIFGHFRTAPSDDFAFLSYMPVTATRAAVA